MVNSENGWQIFTFLPFSCAPYTAQVQELCFYCHLSNNPEQECRKVVINCYRSLSHGGLLIAKPLNCSSSPK